MKLIVCDAGPIIHLHETGSLKLLQNLGKIEIPQTVKIEILANTPLEQLPEWIKVLHLSNYELKQASVWSNLGELHQGEAEALILAKRENADMILTDDSAARFLFSLMGMEVHGTLGVIIWNCGQNFIGKDGAKSILDKIAHSSLWLTEKILAHAKTTLDNF